MSGRILPHVQRLELVEPSPNLAATLRSRFSGDPRVSIVAETLEQRFASLPAATIDTVVMINLLEHIEDDTGALLSARRVLRPGGHLLIFVPALPFLFSRLDAAVGHYRRYTRTTLRERVAAAGLDVVETTYFDVLGIAPWFLVNRLLGRTTINPRLAGLYDRIGVPATRALEKLVPPPIGKNLIMVARRPTERSG